MQLIHQWMYILLDDLLLKKIFHKIISITLIEIINFYLKLF